MSGDVQPRKRKDKKRKKDDSAEQIPAPPQIIPPTSSTQNEDINIHVHKEDGTGGGICAKIIFVVLFGALAILVGLIITEHRGLTDLDTVEQESRFSHLFEGWIDNSVGHDEHDEDDHVVSSLEDEDHGEEEGDSHEAYEEEEEEEDHDDHEEEASEEVAQTEEEDEEEEEETEVSEEVPATEEEEEEEEEEDAEEDDEEESNVSPIEDEEDESELKDADEDEEASPENIDDEEEEEGEEEDTVSKEIEQSVEDQDQDEEDEGEEEAVASQEAASEEENAPEQSKENGSEELKEDEELSQEQEEAEIEEKEEGEEAEDENQQNSKSINVGGDNEPEESESDKQSDAETDEYENITNKDDYKIKEKLDEAHKNIQNNTAYAIKLFDALLQNYSSSPRSLYGKAQALDVLADKKRSNDILQKAITIYLQILSLENVPDALFEAVADRCVNRMRFMGNYKSAIDIHHKLTKRFPEVTRHKHQLVVSYLTINRVNKARELLEDILSNHPNDGFALVHYGFILKTTHNKLNESVSYLQRGISTKAPGVIDGRFYFHLGDALARLGKTKDAMKVYEDGVKHNLFLSKYQRSLYNVARLKGQPWWKKEDTPYAELYAALENNWQKIREEGISVLNKNGLFQGESENLKDTGDWKQFELFARGQKNVNNCKKCPITCRIIESVPNARGCRRGQTKFSVMHPGTHVWPHCGPTNCRLRVHLGLKVPPHTYIRVADEMRSWKNGEVLIFDDSFEHEVWHNGTSYRLVLIVDVWHPELTSTEKRSLSPI